MSRRAVLAAPALLALSRPARPEARLAAAAATAARFDRLRALIVMADGREVLAERTGGPALDAPVNVKSVSKSIVTTLLGIAIDRGVVPSVEATLGDVAPALIPPGADPRVQAITLGDLASLRAGLERTSGGNYGEWVASADWVADALSRPMLTDPGLRMAYSTGSTHVLGAALATASGRSLLDLARDWLGAPLGIDIPAWTRDPQGFYLGGNEMALSPRALAVFGETIRRGGVHDGTRVVSRAWIDAALEPRTRSPFSGLAYGYGWFLGRGPGGRYALARGYGGQVVLVSPGARVTVVVTSDPTRPARSRGYFGDLMRLIETDILAALA